MMAWAGVIAGSPVQASPGGWAQPWSVVLIWGFAVGGLAMGQISEADSRPVDPASSAAPIFVEFDPPPLLLPEATELQRLRDEMARDDSSVGRSLAQMVRQAEASLGRQPRPLAVLIYEGRLSNDPQRIKTVEHLQDMQRLHELVWAYRLTGRESFAEAGIRSLVQWMAACRPSGNDVNDHKLMPLLEAYAVWRDRLSPSRGEQAESWLAELDQANRAGLAEDYRQGRGNTNRAAKRVKMLMCSAVLRDHAADIDRAVADYRRHVEAALRPDGRSVDLERRDAMHYHISEVRSLIETAVLARGTGRDLLDQTTPQGASLRKSLDFVVPYARQEKVYAEWVNSTIALDRRRWEAGDLHYQPGRPWDPATAADVFCLAALLDTRYADLARQWIDRPGSSAGPILSGAIGTKP
jgi:hypothetical protein